MRITILRHGEPDFAWARSARGSKLGRLIDEYNAASIVGSPPDESLMLPDQHKMVICSDLPRSIQSAQAIGTNEIHLSSPLFREIDLPSFDSLSFKLPLKYWAIALRILWFLGFSKNTESSSMARERAKLASTTLIEMAEKHDSVLFVGHGYLNYYLAKELLKADWVGPGRPGELYWTFTTYESSPNSTRLD